MGKKSRLIADLNVKNNFYLFRVFKSQVYNICCQLKIHTDVDKQ